MGGRSAGGGGRSQSTAVQRYRRVEVTLCHAIESLTRGPCDVVSDFSIVYIFNVLCRLFVRN